MNKRQLLSYLFSTALLLITNSSWAFQPTPMQLDMLKNLSPAEQQKLAAQYGVSLGGSTASTHPQPDLGNTTPANSQGTGEQPRLAPAGMNTPIDTGPSTTLGNQAIERNAAEGTNALTLTDEKEKAATNQKLQLFGYDLFNNDPTAFAPATDIPIPTDYVMGPGDNLVIQLYGKQNISYALVVNREGQIQFPEIGPINVSGLPFSEVQALIDQTVSHQMIGVKSSVTMGALRSIRVFVLGEAARPGSYTVSSLSTMTNALLASGGITKIGSLRNIQLKRQGRVVTNLDLYDLLLKGDTTNDARLLPGDVIFIPPIGKTAGVAGEVRRPAIYELKGEQTAQDLVKLAGDLLPTGYAPATRIERITRSGERTVVDIDLSSSRGQQTRIADADVIQVFSVLDTMQDIVLLEGHVKRPGGFAWKPGLRVSTVIGSLNDLLPDPDLNVAVIQRELPPTRQLSVLTLNLGNALQNPGSTDDLKLEPRDKLVIFNFTEDRNKQLAPLITRLQVQANREQFRKTVSIGGNVRYPGEYPLIDGMGTRDLITLAGGLTESAYSLEAEITRFTLDEKQRRLANHLRVNLSDGNALPLEPEDQIIIKRLPEWVGQQKVELSGEVMFPGTYTIGRNESLPSLIQRAGGLTELAYPEGAVFSREELRVLEEQRLTELKQRMQADLAASNIEQQSEEQKVATADAQMLLKSLDSLKPVGRMVIDLPDMLANPGNYQLTLKNGDKLNVPSRKNAVTVLGEVQYPTSHLFEKSLDVQDYIERSGGTNQRADKKRVYVVKANGRVFLPEKSGWFSSKSAELAAGDTIVVPMDAERIKPLTLWTNVSQVFYQLALGAAAVATF